MSYIKLSKLNFFHNLNEIKKRVSTIENIAVVLKDNAYGHGAIEIAKLSKEYGIKKAVVRTYEEAIEIKDYFENIISLTTPKKIKIKKNKNIEYVINDIYDLKKIEENNVKIHLKIDTGMYRNGIDKSQLKEAIDIIVEKKLNLIGVMTHYRSADVLSSELFWQEKNFETIKSKIKLLTTKNKIKTPIFHSKASHSVFRTNCKNDDLVRVGLSIYGYLDLPRNFNTPKLKPVMSLWAEKISTRVVKKGSKVGYGGSFEVYEDMYISNYDIGYADGFPRLNETHNYFINNEDRIIGRVSMDNLSINSTNNCVELFNNVNNLSKATNRINYDILVSLRKNIKKIIF
jgi:alanine racemase